MKRRTFIKRGLVAGAAAALIGRQLSARAESDAEMIAAWVQENGKQIAAGLARQTQQRGHPWDGGFPDKHGIYHVGTAANHARILACGLVMPESAFHQSTKVTDSLLALVEFLNRRQHDDGTIDLITTNFHSPPDTGFVVEPLSVAVNCLQRDDQKWEHLVRPIRQFLVKAGAALSRGGIHTPNHRWVVCMALARINRLQPDEKYRRRIDQWLREKIDIDPDGQYTEQSTSVYSPLVNRCLITVGRLMGRLELLEPVRKNLDLTQYFVRSNGEVVTDASKRQDQFRVSHMERYYYAYRYLAVHDNNPAYSAMARFIEQTAGPPALAGNLGYLLEDSGWMQPPPTPGRLPTSYARHFRHSNLVRIRRGATDITILGGNDRVVTFHKGAAGLIGVRLATAFFGKGQFVSDSVNVVDGKYVLRQKLVGPYYQPLDPEHLPDDGNWSKMPRHLRRQSEVQQLTSTISMNEIDGRLELQFDVRGTDHVPLAIELGFRHGGSLTGVVPLDQPSTYLLERDHGKFVAGDDVIEFGPGRAPHRWTQLRGAAPKLDAQSVYLTGYTPFQFELTIK